MTDQLDAAGNPIVPPAPGAGTTGGLPDDPIKKAQAELAQAKAETAEWQKRFGGLQGKYQQEQEKWATTSAKLLDIDESSKKLTAELEALKLEHAKVDEEKDTYLTDLETTKGQLDRLTIITTEFPHLLPLLGNKPEEDSLPDGAGDELRGKLKAMSEKIESIKKGTANANSLGASPNNPPGSIPKDAEALLRQAVTEMRAGHMEEYNKLYAQYIEKTQSPKGG